MSEHVGLLLHGYIDGEVDIVQALKIEEHLQGCISCSQQYHDLIAMRSAIKQSPLYHPAPRGLEQRVVTSVRKANQSPRTRIFQEWRWILAGAFLIGVVFLALNILRQVLPQAQEARLADEIQSAHVRSLMANHLTDIASTDQHTVKPWFNGKLDFSPSVVDLSAQGFPLIGGRLDYIDAHPVAALVYQRNKHEINLFIWPTTNSVQELRFSTYNGYNIYRWTQSGMEYWAVSDLNPDELKNFVGLVQKNF